MMYMYVMMCCTCMMMCCTCYVVLRSMVFKESHWGRGHSGLTSRSRRCLRSPMTAFASLMPDVQSEPVCVLARERERGGGRESFIRAL